MGDATEEFFNGLGARGHVPELESASGTLRIDVTDGKGTTRWLVTIEKGDVAVSHRNAKADCVVRADKSVFEGIASGKQNAMAALLRGAVDVQGDNTLLLPFQRLFPAPPRRAR
jgi:putative sterol carrier protein